MANGAAGRYTVYIDNTEAERALVGLRNRATELTARIRSIQAAGGDATREMQRLANTNQSIRALETNISRGLTRSFRDLQSEVRRLQGLLNRATDPETIRQLNAQLVTARRNMLTYEAQVLNVASAQRRLAAENANFFSRLGEGIKANFFGNLAVNSVMMVVGFLKQMVTESIRVALEAEGVRNAFSKLGDPALLSSLRSATRGTVSDLELMKKAVAAENFQIPLTMLGTLLRFAQERARATGQSVDYLTESIITGIARKSPLILDNLGINVQRINAEFSRTGDFVKAAAKIIEEEMTKSGSYVETNADRVDRWAARWENAKQKIGGAILSITDDIGLQFESWFGDAETAAKADEAMFNNFIDRQQAMKEFRERELGALDLFKKKYADGTKKGDAELLQLMKESIAAAEKLQRDAQDQGNVMLSRQLSFRLQLWNGYFKTLGTNTTTAAKNTLEALNAESDLLSKQLNTMEIGSEQFKRTQAEIKRVQKAINDATGKTAEDQQKKDEQKAKESQRKQEQLAKQLGELRIKVLGDTLSPYEKEILESQHKYEELKKQLVKYHIDTKEIEELHSREVVQIYQRHFDALSREFSKGRDLTKTDNQKIRQQVVAATGSSVIRSADYLLNQAQKNNNDDISVKRYELSRATLNSRLRAQLALLDAERKQELTSTEITQTERAEIEERFRKERQLAEIEYYSQLVNIASEFINTILGVFQSLSDAQSRREENELARDRKDNEKKKEIYQRQLDNKVISREEYDRKVEALDRQAEAKEKAVKKRAFEREKTAKIIQANMQIAQAVLQALASAPPPYSFILAAAVAAAGAIQLLTIKNTEAPEFGQGGLLRGPHHKSQHKGMPVMNPITGSVEAMLEGDEAIIKRSAMADKKKYTISGTISQITSTFNAMHGGVSWDSNATIRPVWMGYKQKPIAYSGLTDTINSIRQFENGGRFSNSTIASTPPSVNASQLDPELKILMDQNMQVLVQLNQQLSKGIAAHVFLNQLNSQQQRLNKLADNSTFKP